MIPQITPEKLRALADEVYELEVALNDSPSAHASQDWVRRALLYLRTAATDAERREWEIRVMLDGYSRTLRKRDAAIRRAEGATRELAEALEGIFADREGKFTAARAALDSYHRAFPPGGEKEGGG